MEPEGYSETPIPPLGVSERMGRETTVGEEESTTEIQNISNIKDSRKIKMQTRL